ncbi:MAG: hypothetical protein WC718_02265 [Phycisphaerales bacterium]
MSAPHSCPRCGYDLTGEITRWVEACPLAGRCPECGTEFEWENIFHSERFELPWLVEHGPGGLDLVRRWSATFVRVLRPRQFWSQVRTTHTVSVWRAVTWLLLPCVVLHLISSALVVAASCVARRTPPTWDDAAGALLYPATAYDWTYNGVEFYFVSPRPVYVVMLMAGSLVWGLIFAALPWTRKLAKLRTAHIARVWIYSMWWVVSLFAFRAARNLWQLAINGYWRASSRPVGATPAAVLTFQPRPLALFDCWPLLVGSLLALWLLWWWWCAFHIGWQLHRATLLWSLLLVAALLAAIVSVVDGDLLLEYAKFAT